MADAIYALCAECVFSLQTDDGQQKQHHDKMNYLQEQTHTLNSAASRIMRLYVYYYLRCTASQSRPSPCVCV